MPHIHDDQETDSIPRVMLWSAPRTLSTCVERVLLESSAVHVHHEPFGVPFYWSEDAPSSRQAGDRRRAG